MNDDIFSPPCSSSSELLKSQNEVALFPISRVIELSEKNLQERNYLMDLQDDLHMTLLASQAIVDSKDAHIFTIDEVEALKKVSISYQSAERDYILFYYPGL